MRVTTRSRIAVVGDGQDGPLEFFRYSPRATPPRAYRGGSSARRAGGYRSSRAADARARFTRVLAAGETVEVLLPRAAGMPRPLQILSVCMSVLAAAGLKARGKRVVFTSVALSGCAVICCFSWRIFVLDVRRLPERPCAARPRRCSPRGNYGIWEMRPTLRPGAKRTSPECGPARRSGS